VTARPNVVAIVLAGGESRRFGTDKLAAALDGRPLLHHSLETVAAVADRTVVVVAPGAPLPSCPAELVARVSFSRDAETFGGPLAGLAAGLSALAPGADASAADAAIVLVVGGDMPWIVPAVLGLLVDALVADATLGAATLEADPPTALPMAVRPGLAGRAAEDLLRENRRALRGLLGRVPSIVVPSAAWRALDPGGRTLRDVDAPEDLRRH
jgi:molybdopterin-guanine dinucleotide biosynthesis protein A